jgi:hypothetical protein
LSIFGSNDDKIDEYEEKKRQLKETKKRLQKLEREKEEREKKRLSKIKKAEDEREAEIQKAEDEIEAEIQKDKDERLAEIQKAEDEKKEAERKLARIKQIENEEQESIKKAEEEKNRANNEIESNILKEKNKILEEEKRIKDQINKLAKEKQISKILVKRYKNNILLFTNKLKEIQNKEQEKISEKKKIIKKIENQERLYDPNKIKTISDSVSLRIFYDLEKKKKAYWKSTDFINRIEIREKEWNKELEIKKNIVKLKINWTAGEKDRIERLNAGGVMEHRPFDAPSYSLRISFTIEEQYLIKKIMSLIKASFPKMSVFENKFGISAYLEDQNYEEVYSRRIIQTTARRICEEFEKMGDVVID